MTARRKRAAPRESDITVVVNRSDEPIDFDAWVKSYVRTILAMELDPARQDTAAAAGNAPGAPETE